MNSGSNIRVDPFIYEKDWPHLSFEDKWKAMIKFMGSILRGSRMVIEKKFGGDVAKDIAQEMWKAIFIDYMDDMEEMLGVKGRRDAIAATKWCAYADEEICGFTATCLEANKDCGERVVISCPLGDCLEKKDCAFILEGMRQCIETRFPGYTFQVKSTYHDDRMCRYKILKK